MILPEESAPPQPPKGPKRVMKACAVASAASALALVAFLGVNGHTPISALVLAAQVAGVASGVLGGGALLAGFWLIRISRADLRRPAAFLVVATLAVFLAHLYVVNSPPTSTSSTISGQVGQTFGDSHVLVSSQVRGSQVSIRIVNVGSNSNGSYNAIGGVTLELGGASLPASSLRPEPSLQAPLQPEPAASLGFHYDATGTWAINSSSSSQLTVEYQYLTCYHVPAQNDPRGVFGCVMDESYYVPSAMGILTGDQCAPYADSCNLEHPPLAKALIAGGMAVFGIGDLGYRISELVLGTLSIPLVFVLVEALSGDRRLSYFATVIFAADPMFFVHSSAALIDVPAIFFSLLAMIFYFRRCRLWRINNFMASGVFFGLAVLSKETAVFALMAVLTYELLFGGGGVRASFSRELQIIVPAGLVFMGALQVFDSLFTSAALPWFYQQIQFVLSYGSGLKGGGWCLGASPCPNGPFITPLNWLTFSPPVSYLVISIISSAGSYVSVGYYGAANPAIVWMVYLWVPVTLYPLVKERRWRGALGPERQMGAFLLVWFLWSYVPYLLLWAYGRVTYPFYILPAIPPLAMGAAYFLTRPFFPRKMAVVYVVAVFGIFFLFFPVKDFLPAAVRVVLGH